MVDVVYPKTPFRYTQTPLSTLEVHFEVYNPEFWYSSSHLGTVCPHQRQLGYSLYPNYHTVSSSKCSSNEVFIGAILKPLGRNDYKAISTHFDATPSSKFSAEFVYNFVTD